MDKDERLGGRVGKERRNAMGFPFQPPGGFLGPSGRRVGSDGLLEIKCRICEKTICKEQYRGFSTAICAVCQGAIEQGQRPEEIMARTKQKEEEEARELYNDIGGANFKAMGIGQRVKEVIQKVKQAAQGRRRAPLFAKKDKP